MPPTFDLLEKPWIPVRWLDATMELVSLRTALARAAQIRSLECPNPVRQISMLRLLLAVCHRANRLADIDAAVERLSGDWPSDVFEAYFDVWADRFDLYGKERPFLQVPWLARHEKTVTKLHGVGRITIEWAAGNSKLLMDHHPEGGEFSLSAAEAAQILVAYQQFCPGGLSKVFKDSAAGGPGMGFAHVWVTASSLARMLTLNQLLQSKDDYQTDRPAWELEVPAPEALIDPQPAFSGPASRYAHLTRSILLRPEADGSCMSLHWAEGITRDVNPMGADPMEARRPGKDSDWLPVRLAEERAIWRDTLSLVITSGSRPPATVRYAIQLLQAADESQPVTLGVGGLLADKAKLVLWRLEQINAPAAVLASPLLQAALTKALKVAEDTGRNLYGALYAMAEHLLRENGQADKADIRRVVEGFPGQRQYWHQLDLAFPGFLARLVAPEAIDPALQDWRLVLRNALRVGWDGSVDSAGQTRRAFLAAARADSAYRRAVSNIDDSLEVAREGKVVG